MNVNCERWKQAGSAKSLSLYSIIYICTVLFISDQYLFVLKSRRSTVQSTVQATCGAGTPVSWKRRVRVMQINRIALTSAVWSLLGASTPTRLPKLMAISGSNPQSSSHAIPWMASSPLLIKGKLEFECYSFWKWARRVIKSAIFNYFRAKCWYCIHFGYLSHISLLLHLNVHCYDSQVGF